MTRLNKEIKLDICNNISLKYGTVNKNDPQIIYISGKMWIQPKFDGDFEEPINYMYKKFKKELSTTLKNNLSFEFRHILDFDINSENLIYGKKKFVSISFFIKQKKDKILNLKSIKSIVVSNFGYLFNELENELINNDFVVTKKKR